MVHDLRPAPPMAEQRLRMTYEAYLDWATEDVRAEWVAGEVIVFMPITFDHQLLVGYLYEVVSLFVRVFQLGDVLLAPAQMRIADGQAAREPDIFFLAAAHRDRRARLGIEGPADLVIEVISDDSVTRDRVDKLAEYEAAGIPEYWLFDPRPDRPRTTFNRLTAAGVYEEVPLDPAGRFVSEVLPSFWFEPAWLWQDPRPAPLGLIKRIAPDALRAFVLAPETEPPPSYGRPA